MKYFHEITEDELKTLIEVGITFEELKEKHPQPDWCTYTDALLGLMGCWGLVFSRTKINKEYCKNCECFKERNPQS